MAILPICPDVNPVPPTVCMNWLKCPTYGYLASHWEPIEEWTPNRLLGVAIGKGLEVIMSTDKLPSGLSEEDVVFNTIKEGYIEQDSWSLEAVQSLALKGLRAACKTVAKDIWEREKVLATELDVGGARVDLVTQRGTDLIVTDYKTKLQCKPEWIKRDLLETECDWQLWDYAWRVGAYYGRSVTFKRRVIIVLSPTVKVDKQEALVTEAGLNAWLAGATEEWRYIRRFMDALPGPVDFNLTESFLPLRTTSCYGRYGKCPMYEACWSADRDPERMKVLYVER